MITRRRFIQGTAAAATIVALPAARTEEIGSRGELFKQVDPNDLAPGDIVTVDGEQHVVIADDTEWQEQYRAEFMGSFK